MVANACVRLRGQLGIIKLKVGHAAKIAMLSAFITAAKIAPAGGNDIGIVKLGKISVQQVIPSCPKFNGKLKLGKEIKTAGICGAGKDKLIQAVIIIQQRQR